MPDTVLGTGETAMDIPSLCPRAARMQRGHRLKRKGGDIPQLRELLFLLQERCQRNLIQPDGQGRHPGGGGIWLRRN